MPLLLPVADPDSDYEPAVDPWSSSLNYLFMANHQGHHQGDNLGDNQGGYGMTEEGQQYPTINNPVFTLCCYAGKSCTI